VAGDREALPGGHGLEKNQFIVTRHTDTEHEHIHILANRIRFDGSVTSDSQDYKRQEALMRELERDYGLQRVAPSREAERRGPTKGEIEGSLPHRPASTRSNCSSFATARPRTAEFHRIPGAARGGGVELVPVAQLKARSCPACRTGWTA
jgi:hypothetical protein